MNNIKNSETDLTAILIKLLQGLITTDDKKYWDKLITHQEFVRDYFSKLGLFLYLDQDDGYAFLRSIPPPSMAGVEEEGDVDLLAVENAEQEANFPSLIRKMPLTFELSFFCVLLREALEHFDESVSDDFRLVLKRVDIYEMLKTFYPENNDESKQKKKLDALINKVVDLGFLRQLSNAEDSFEVKRVIKALVDAGKLKEIKEQMQLHLAIGSADNTSGEQETL